LNDPAHGPVSWLEVAFGVTDRELKQEKSKKGKIVARSREKEE